MSKASKLFETIIRKMLTQPARPSEDQVCPVCGKPIKFFASIHFHQRRQQWEASAQLACEHCQKGVVLDGLDPIPDWLLEEKEEAERRQNEGK